MEIDYSVLIRTTGHAGEKYRALLRSINSLEPKPKEVIVVLPEGYPIPKDRLGTETFCFATKGMVSQRVAGIDRCNTAYALVCDDDVAFESDFVMKLYAPISEGKCFFSAAPLYSFLPRKGINSVLCCVMGSAVPTVFHRKDRYISILKSSGYSYNRHLDAEHARQYETQSVAWTCFFFFFLAFRKLEFEKEALWLDSHGYSALDDQTMFYKAWLMGLKTIIVSDAVYEHLDARTSTSNNRSAASYSATFNRVIFWNRFIGSLQKGVFRKTLSFVAFEYRMRWLLLWNQVNVWRHKMSQADQRLAEKGYRDGWRYIQTEEYKNLPRLKLR